MDFLSELGGSDPYKPSIFELIGQEQLRDLLQPALKYVLSVSTRKPDCPLQWPFADLPPSA